MNKYLIVLGCLLTFVLWGCSGEREDDLIDILANEKAAIHDYLNQKRDRRDSCYPFL